MALATFAVAPTRVTSRLSVVTLPSCASAPLLSVLKLLVMSTFLAVTTASSRNAYCFARSSALTAFAAMLMPESFTALLAIPALALAVPVTVTVSLSSTVTLPLPQMPAWAWVLTVALATLVSALPTFASTPPTACVVSASAFAV